MFNDTGRWKCVISLWCSVSNFENSKITIKTWPFPKAYKGSSWNRLCKKQMLCSLPIQGTQYYYSNKNLTKTYILEVKKKKREKLRERSHDLSKFMKTLYQNGRGRHLIIAGQPWPAFWQASNSTAKHKRRRDNKCSTTEAFLSLYCLPAEGEENQLMQRGHFSVS